MTNSAPGGGGFATALLVRLAIYGVLGALMFEAVVRCAAVYPVDVFAKEGGPLEIAQHVFGFASAVLFFAAAATAKARKALFVLLGLCALSFVIREADHFFDVTLGRGSYKVFVTAVGACALYVAAADRKRLPAQVISFVATPAFFFGIFAVFTIAIYGQIVGQKELWHAVMGANYERVVKDSVEEIQELLGYFMLLIAATESLIYERRAAIDGR